MACVVRASLFALCLSSVAVAASQSGTSVVPPGDVDASLLSRVDALAAGEADAGLLSGVIVVARGDRVLYSARTVSPAGSCARRRRRPLASVSGRLPS
jgi:hypothetical protein